MHRPTVGWIAVALAFGGLLLRALYPSDTSFSDACWRPAIVLGLLWLALPQLKQLSPWMVLGVVAAALLVLWNRRALLLVVPILAVLWLLRPRGKGG